MHFPNANKFTVTPNRQACTRRSKPQQTQRNGSRAAQQSISDVTTSNAAPSGGAGTSFWDILVGLLFVFGPGALIFALGSYLMHPIIGLGAAVYCTYKIFKSF